MTKKKKEKKLSYDELVEKSEDYLNGWKRAQADYANLEREIESKKSDWIRLANEDLLIQILPVYDNLKLALEHASGEKNDWVVGVEHVVAQFKKVLEDNSVEEIETVGAEFDPEVHEAIKKESKGNIIKKQVSAGYKLNGKVLYPAKVIL
jgi:molecular chaperone GrpE